MAKLNYQTVLIVDHDLAVRMVLAQAVSDAGGSAILCGSVGEALVIIARTKVSAAILGKHLSVSHPELRQHLIRRKIPYIWHRDLAELHGSGAPDSAGKIMDRIAKLLRERHSPSNL